MEIKYLLVVAVLATAVFGFNSVVNAQSMDIPAQIQALQQQIAQLMAQIQALQAQQGQGQAWCHTFSKNLRIGDRGTDVDALVTTLVKEGIIDNSSNENIRGEDFNEQVASAVVEFQEKYASEILTPSGLRRGTGYVGPATRAKLNILYGCGVTQTPTTQPDLVISPTNLVRGQTYHFSGKVKNALPNSLIYFYIKSPNGTMQQSGVDVGTTNPSGNYSLETSQNIWIGAQTGTYTGWVTIGDKKSNEVSFTVSAASATPTITVTSPNGGEILKDGQPFEIKWSSSGLTSGKNLVIYLEKKASGQTQFWNIATLAQNLQQNGTYVWTPDLDNITNAQYKIMVSEMGLSGLEKVDESDNYFTIAAAGTTSYLLNISGITGMKSVYAPGEKISFSVKGVELDGTAASDEEGFNVQAYVCKNGDCNNYLTPNPDGSYNGIYNSSTGLWNVAMNAPSDTAPAYSMRVVLYCSRIGSSCWNNYSRDSQVEKLSNFIVNSSTQPTITVTYPNTAGMSFLAGQGQVIMIKWDSQGVNNVYIKLRKGNDTYNGPEGMITGTIPNTGGYNWTVPSTLPAGTDYSIRVIDATTLAIDDSDNNFSIISSTVQSGGPLVVSLDGSTPVIQTFNAGQTDATFARIKLTNGTAVAINNMNGIQLGSSSTNASDYLTNIKIYDGSTQIGQTATTLTSNGSYYYAWVNLSGLSIPSNTTKTLTIKADVKSTASTGSVNLGIAGLNFDQPGCTTSGMPKYGYNMNITGTTTTQPTITVTSPNGGETWNVGETHDITWTSNNTNRVYISWHGYNGSGQETGAYIINTETPANAQKFSWNIPSDVIFSDKERSKILISLSATATVSSSTDQDASDNYFTIGASRPTTSPTLSSISNALQNIAELIRALSGR